MKHFESKISRVLVLYIILFSSIVTLFLTSIQLYLDYKDGINTLEQKIDQIELTNLDSITQSLWTIDYSSVQIQLDGLTRISDIIYAELVDESEEIIAKSGKKEVSNTISKTLKLQQDYRGAKTGIGELTVIATKENLYNHLIDTAIIILISQAIKTFLVSTFILVIFYYLVTRHLKKITSHAESIKLGRKSEPLKIERGEHRLHKGDELDRLVNAINITADNIYKSYNDFINSQHIISEREAKFSAMFDSISDAIVYVDCDRKIVQTNAAFEKQFGYSLDEVKGKTTQLLYADPEQYIEQGQQRYNTKANKAPGIYEIIYRRKDGSVFPSETMGGAITLADNTKLGFIGIIRDIEYRKKAEEENQRLQKQLQQSQKMDAIGQLTGGIAHDFNNILASILGYSELLKTILVKSPDPKPGKYIKHILTAGERARDLVAQLLAFSRSSPGDPQVISLPDLIEEVTSLIRPTIPSSISLKLEIDKDAHRVLMDNTQMHQILMNLCINARDAMGGHGSLSIKLSNVHYEDALCSSCKELIHGDYVKLTVQDTGTGIEDGIFENIFDPFQSTKNMGEGTGMGLSVVHGILHKHLSHIIVETKVGSGSSFHILIPPYTKSEPVPVIKTEDIKQLPGGPNKAHILIVDDEEALAEFLKDLLEEHQYRVTTSTSSKLAVETIRQNPQAFDLIITDQTMPDLTGIDMIKQIFEIRPDIPVFLSSGHNDQASEKEALAIGCTKYLCKPINTNLLIESIEETLTEKAN